MKAMKIAAQKFNAIPSSVRNLSIGVVSMASAAAANAADGAIATAAQTALTDAQTQGTSVGGYVVATVAALCVVGIVLMMVRKV
ncbi:TPA: major capsid protein [Klebsiella pneumoniae]|nr:major capsid protein [Klebsiella pneumoniae]